MPKHQLIPSCYYIKLTFILGEKKRENPPHCGNFEWRHKAYTTQLRKDNLKISLFCFHLLRRITLTLDEWRMELNFPPSVNSSTVWLEDVNRAGDLRPTVKCEGASSKGSGSEGACLTLTFQNCRSRVFFVSCLLKGAGSWGDVRADVSSLPLHEYSWPFAVVYFTLCISSLFLFSSGILPWRAIPECDFSVSPFSVDHAEI